MNWMKRETLLLNADKLFLQTKDNHYLRGNGSMCVRGRDAYTGADLERAPAIDRVKLPVKERNQYVFKGEAGCMRCMRVGSIDTARRVEKRSRYCKSAITFRGQVVSFPILICKIMTPVRRMRLEWLHVCGLCISVWVPIIIEKY